MLVCVLQSTRCMREMDDGRARHDEPITLLAKSAVVVSALCAGCKKSEGRNSELIAKSTAWHRPHIGIFVQEQSGTGARDAQRQPC
jgi:hypothetical protein